MQLKNTLAATVLAGAAVLSAAAPAQASIYDNVFAVTASEGLTNGGFDTATGNPFIAPGLLSNTAGAAFTYTGPLNFSNTAPQNSGQGDTNKLFGLTRANISMYKGSGIVLYNNGTIIPTPVADFTTKGGFVDSSASAGTFAYGTYFTSDLGTVQSGTVLTITHDDGISLFQGAAQIGTTTSGATGAITETVRINTTADTVLRYSRQNGTPSVLQVAVPEPMSMALLGAGLAGLGLVRRKTRAV